MQQMLLCSQHLIIDTRPESAYPQIPSYRTRKYPSTAFQRSESVCGYTPLEEQIKLPLSLLLLALQNIKCQQACSWSLMKIFILICVVLVNTPLTSTAYLLIYARILRHPCLCAKKRKRWQSCKLTGRMFAFSYFIMCS